MTLYLRIAGEPRAAINPRITLCSADVHHPHHVWMTLQPCVCFKLVCGDKHGEKTGDFTEMWKRKEKICGGIELTRLKSSSCALGSIRLLRKFLPPEAV